MAEDILITDLSCARPTAGWTDADSQVHKPIAKPPAGLWRIIDYKTDHYDGRALMTTRPDSWELKLPLNRRGWHAICIGMSERQWGQAAIELRLSGQEHWQLFHTSAGDGGGPVHEEPWLFADLTGQDLELRYPRHNNAAGNDLPTLDTVGSIYSVRLRPISPEHVELLAGRRHAPMVYINDGFGIFYQAAEPGPQIVDQAFEAFADGDWDICSFGNIGGDLVNFPATAGTLCGQDGWDMVRAGDIRCRDNLGAMIAAGQDPLQQAIDKAHSQGHKLWMYLRPQAYMAEPPYDHILRSRFFSEHPELRCVEANGKPISKLSLAYPEVRANLNVILEEALKRGADGLTLAFVRGYPCVRYEEPVCRRFAALYGEDARQQPDSEPRLRQLWAEFVTAWLQEVRGMLDDCPASDMSPRRELSVIVGPDFEWNLRFGFNVREWAHSGLVNAVMPYPYVKDGEIDVAAFAEAFKGTSTLLLPSLGTYAQNIRVAEIRQRANRFYAAGANGLSRWDCPAQLARLRLDDPVRQSLWCEHYLPPQDIQMTEFAGQNLEAFGPMLGF